MFPTGKFCYFCQAKTTGPSSACEKCLDDLRIEFKRMKMEVEEYNQRNAFITPILCKCSKGYARFKGKCSKCYYKEYQESHPRSEKRRDFSFTR